MDEKKVEMGWHLKGITGSRLVILKLEDTRVLLNGGRGYQKERALHMRINLVGRDTARGSSSLWRGSIFSGGKGRESVVLIPSLNKLGLWQGQFQEPKVSIRQTLRK